MDDDDIQANREAVEGEMVILADPETGRTIACTVERFLAIEEQDYALLLPIDTPIEIFVWQAAEDEEEEDEEAVPVEDDDDIDMLFTTAKAVLEEQNLTLKRTAVMLTVEGELPDLDEEADFEGLEAHQDLEEAEELQYLASFFYDDQEFAVYAPLDPCFILAKLDSNNHPHLLSADELKTLEPLLEQIEDQFFDEFDSP